MGAATLHLTPGSRSWPADLDEIEDRPRDLWLRGRVELLAVRPRVAVVGTRSPTAYGQVQAARFARALAERGVLVVSGLARGVDQAAHEGALDAGGATVAVLGSGVDVPWPACPLAERMAREGLLLSEYAPGEPPRKHHFPRRNRLISGLAQALVVIEAGEVSGSLITARWAADQGREVFALPGRVDHPMARGSHRLIREGAQLVEDPGEVLQALGLSPCRASPIPARGGAFLEPGMEQILSALSGETLTADELGERLRREPGGLLAQLVQLELAGRVARLPGGLYRCC